MASTAGFKQEKISFKVDPNDFYSQAYYSIVFNESENLIYYIYSDNRDFGVYNIYVQQFDVSGNTTWDSSLKVAETSVDDASYVSGTANDNDGTTIALTLAF